MSEQQVRKAVLGDDAPTTDVAQAIGAASKRLEDIADEMVKARTEDTGRFNELREEQQRQAEILTGLKAKAEAEQRESDLASAVEAAKEWKAFATDFRTPSKAHIVAGDGRLGMGAGYQKGDFLFGVHEANARDTDRQAAGKAILAGYAGKASLDGFTYQESWGKATLGTTDATGGWVIPNAIVDEFIVPATVDNIYRRICTVVPGVTAATVDIPFRLAARTRATVVAWGDTKENKDLVYNGYTATMYTLARIYDVANQFLRKSRGAAEADVLAELAAAFAIGESYYVREGSGSSQPFGYTSALTNGPSGFRSSFSPSATTLAGSIAASIATAGGALAGRGVRPDAAVMTATSYWTMLSQGTDTAGFFFNPSGGPGAINALPGTLVSPFGIPVYPDAAADVEATAAVLDNLVVGQFKKFKLYFGDTYRVDSSDEAGTRWDTNLTGFRGEEEMGFDARPAVYAGYFQMITDILP
jgi:HK97 family phage major capsid protein